ncbi:MAG: hypothetical protein K0R19_3195 [Bacillota bacterium]|jgi:hypothetical protein|nr:hypothetical protein [Bacillota bacterium]
MKKIGKTIIVTMLMMMLISSSTFAIEQASDNSLSNATAEETLFENVENYDSPDADIMKGVKIGDGVLRALSDEEVKALGIKIDDANAEMNALPAASTDAYDDYFRGMISLSAQPAYVNSNGGYTYYTSSIYNVFKGYPDYNQQFDLHAYPTQQVLNNIKNRFTADGVTHTHWRCVVRFKIPVDSTEFAFLTDDGRRLTFVTQPGVRIYQYTTYATVQGSLGLGYARFDVLANSATQGWLNCGWAAIYSYVQP